MVQKDAVGCGVAGAGEAGSRTRDHIEPSDTSAAQPQARQGDRAGRLHVHRCRAAIDRAGASVDANVALCGNAVDCISTRCGGAAQINVAGRIDRGGCNQHWPAGRFGSQHKRAVDTRTYAIQCTQIHTVGSDVIAGGVDSGNRASGSAQSERAGGVVARAKGEIASCCREIGRSGGCHVEGATRAAPIVDPDVAAAANRAACNVGIGQGGQATVVEIDGTTSDIGQAGDIDRRSGIQIQNAARHQHPAAGAQRTVDINRTQRYAKLPETCDCAI